MGLRIKGTVFPGQWDDVPAVSSHSQRRTGRAKVRPAPDKPSHRKMDGQSHRTLANRDNGPQGRMTPDRRRGMLYGGISPSFSIMRRRGSECLSCACRWTDCLERLTRRVAVTQNGLVDHVTALKTAPDPISPPDWSDIHTHAMLIHKQAPAPPARNRPVCSMGERSLRRRGFHCPRDAGEASSIGTHEVLPFTVLHRLWVSLPSRL